MNTPSASAAQTVKLDITGMTCAGCASRLEKTLKATEGVVNATVNFALEMAEVDHLPQIAANDLVDVVTTAGFEAKERRDEAEAAQKAFEEREAHSDAEERKTFQLFALSTLLAIPLVIPMVLMAFGVQFELSGVLQFALATPIQLFVGARFYKAHSQPCAMAAQTWMSSFLWAHPPRIFTAYTTSSLRLRLRPRTFILRHPLSSSLSF
ncbi:cation transporter [Pseudovibrio denitrificans]|uniref:cation transporter n=1 Tax=Pseudovibrio denitrificans TaxID=258256 RepID=UPI000A568988|nr:cation transporter [Pseudovibrio denitrificans]